jgi:hypothetical protein
MSHCKSMTLCIDMFAQLILPGTTYPLTIAIVLIDDKRLASPLGLPPFLFVDPKMVTMAVMMVGRWGAQVRQTALSFDGRTMLACCDDGTIWRWDVDGQRLPYFSEKVVSNSSRVQAGRGKRKKSGW